MSACLCVYSCNIMQLVFAHNGVMFSFASVERSTAITIIIIAASPAVIRCRHCRRHRRCCSRSSHRISCCCAGRVLVNNSRLSCCAVEKWIKTISSSVVCCPNQQVTAGYCFAVIKCQYQNNGSNCQSRTRHGRFRVIEDVEFCNGRAQQHWHNFCYCQHHYCNLRLRRWVQSTVSVIATPVLNVFIWLAIPWHWDDISVAYRHQPVNNVGKLRGLF